MPQPAIRRLICSRLVGMLAFSVTGCNQENAAPPASLQALPEANLPIMPGATIARAVAPRRGASTAAGRALTSIAISASTSAPTVSRTGRSCSTTTDQF